MESGFEVSLSSNNAQWYCPLFIDFWSRWSQYLVCVHTATHPDMIIMGWKCATPIKCFLLRLAVVVLWKNSKTEVMLPSLWHCDQFLLPERTLSFQIREVLIECGVRSVRKSQRYWVKVSLGLFGTWWNSVCRPGCHQIPGISLTLSP